MTIQASNNNVWVRRYKSIKMQGGVMLPDSAQNKLHKGFIVSAGELVSDKKIKDGRTAVFNKTAGFEIEEENITYLILNQGDIIGTDVFKNEEMV